jgi:transposase
VFEDLITKRVLFATPGKKASVCAAFTEELIQYNVHAEAIQRVVIDMSAAYTKGVSTNLGNARVVYDKFNVIQNVVEVCDRIRQAESRADAGKRERLERMRCLWLKNWVITGQERKPSSWSRLPQNGA